MRLVWILSALLLAVAACLGIVMLTPEHPMSTGADHPAFPAMRIGGEGSRFASIAWPVLFLQVAVLSLMLCLAAIGIAPRHRTVGFWCALGGVGLLTIGTWIAVFVSYTAYLETGATPFVWGYPLPAFLSVFGIFAAGGSFTVLFIAGFRRFIFPHEDEAAFEALVREMKGGEQ